MDIVNTYSKSQIDAVIYIAADIEIVLTNIAFVGSVEAEIVSIDVFPQFVGIIPVQIISEEVVQLATRNIRSLEIGHINRRSIRLEFRFGLINIV